MVIQIRGARRCAIPQTWTVLVSVLISKSESQQCGDAAVTATCSFPNVYDVMMSNQPTRKKGVEPTMKDKVSPISVSKGAQVCPGPHGTTQPADRQLPWPFAILSLATLPSRARAGLGQTLAICIQLERSALRVSVRASPPPPLQAGNFNSRVVTLNLGSRHLQRGKNYKIIETDVAAAP